MGIYQLYFLKMHSKLLFLSRNAGTKDPAFLSRVLADTLAAAKEAMRGRNFAHSPYRTKIITLASGAAAALVHLEQGELEKMREEILTALEAAEKEIVRNLTAERQRPQGAVQIESRAKHCRQYFAQRVQSAYCQASDGGVEGVRPLARFLTAFSRKKAVSPKADAFRPHRRAAAAARSRSNRKPQKARLRRADALSYGC